MFKLFKLFDRNKKNFNKVELARFMFNKSENVYSLSSYFNFEPRKKIYGIYTVVKNVPVYADNGNIVAKVKYIGIPDASVYFILHLSCVQKEYVSVTNTIDIIVTATIKNEKCTNYKFELIPMYDRRAIS